MKKEALNDKFKHHLSGLKQYPLEKIGISEIVAPEKGEMVLLLQFRDNEPLEMQVLSDTMNFLENILQAPGMKVAFGIGELEEMRGLREEDYILLHPA